MVPSRCCNTLLARSPTQSISCSWHDGHPRPTDCHKAFMTIGVARISSTPAFAVVSSRPSLAASCRPVAQAAIDSSRCRMPALRPQLCTDSLCAAAPRRPPLHRARADHVCQAQQSSDSVSSVGELHVDPCTVRLLSANVVGLWRTASSGRAEYHRLQHSNAMRSVRMLRSPMILHCHEESSLTRIMRRHSFTNSQ